MAEELNIDLDDYLTMLKDYGNLSIVSIEDLSETAGEDKDRIIRYIVDESDDPEQYAEFAEMERILAEELDKIPERQKLVLTLYYHEDMNMKEIAKALGITEARVCQIHSQALLNLRTSMKKHARELKVHFPDSDNIDVQFMANDYILDRLGKIDGLPTFPGAAGGMIGLLGDPGSSASEVAKHMDPSMAGEDAPNCQYRAVRDEKLPEYRKPGTGDRGNRL